MVVDLDKLTAPFPREAIKQREGGGGRYFDYVEGHTVIHRLNTATGFNWDFTITRMERQGDLLMAVGELTIPGHGKRSGMGVQKISDRGGEDLAKGVLTDALKKAATLFGVGLELYGPDYESGEVAAPLQRSSPRPAPPQGEDIESVPFDGPPLAAAPFAGDMPSEKQIKFMGVLMDKAAISVEDARQVLKERYGKASRQVLTKREATDFIDWLQTQQPAEQAALVN